MRWWWCPFSLSRGGKLESSPKARDQTSTVCGHYIPSTHRPIDAQTYCPNAGWPLALGLDHVTFAYWCSGCYKKDEKFLHILLNENSELFWPIAWYIWQWLWWDAILGIITAICDTQILSNKARLSSPIEIDFFSVQYRIFIDWSKRGGPNHESYVCLHNIDLQSKALNHLKSLIIFQLKHNTMHGNFSMTCLEAPLTIYHCLIVNSPPPSAILTESFFSYS